MSAVRRSKRTILVVSSATLREMLEKGNVWYVQHYAAYFHNVYVAYFLGGPPQAVTRGSTTLTSLGGGRNSKIDLLFAPVRLYRFAKRIGPTSCLTGDLVYSWWTLCICKAVLRFKEYLMPVCMPEQIYRSTRRSLSGLPICVERVFTKLSFLLAHRVLTARSFGSFPNWLSADTLSRRKLIIVDTLVDALPSDGFFTTLRLVAKRDLRIEARKREFRLIYVGRLHREKLVDDLVRMMPLVRALEGSRVVVTLTIVGDGPERERLMNLAVSLGVEDRIKFLGTVPNEELPKHLLNARAFVSPLTGTALREAGLCGLPVIAYDSDWIHGLLKHEDTALLVRPGDSEQMAQFVILLATHERLRNRLSRNFEELAWRMWSPQGLQNSLRVAFQEKEDLRRV